MPRAFTTVKLTEEEILLLLSSLEHTDHFRDENHRRVANRLQRALLRLP